MIPHDYKPSTVGGVSSRHMKEAVFLDQNEHGTLMTCEPDTTNALPILFRNFAMIDIFEAQNILDSIKKNLMVQYIDYNSVLVNFNGKTYFEIFMK